MRPQPGDRCSRDWARALWRSARAALSTGRAQAADNLAMLTWDGYVDPRVLDGFTDQYDTGIDYELHTSDPDSVNKLRAGETAIWDIINLNNPWAREMMWPEGLIVELDRARFDPYFEAMLPMFQPPYKWGDEPRQQPSARRVPAGGYLRLRGQHRHHLGRHGEGRRLGSVQQSRHGGALRHPRLRQLEHHAHLHGRRPASVQGEDRRPGRNVRGGRETPHQRGQDGLGRLRRREPRRGQRRDRHVLRRRHVLDLGGAGSTASATSTMWCRSPGRPTARAGSTGSS